LALRDREWLLNDGQTQNPSAHKLDSGTIYNRAGGFWICLSFKDHFLSRQTLISRFATFASLYRAASDIVTRVCMGLSQPRVVDELARLAEEVDDVTFRLQVEQLAARQEVQR
jgi:hypothetical protein